MAINKKLISFATQAQFDIKLNAGDIDNRSIVFIEDKKRIWTHGVYFDTSWDFVTGKPGTYTPSAHTHGPITNDGKIGTQTNRIIETTTGGLLTHVAKNTAYNKAFGTGANQVAMGNHTHSHITAPRYDTNDPKPNQLVQGLSFQFSYPDGGWHNAINMKSYSDSNYLSTQIASSANNPGADTGYSYSLRYREGRNETWLGWKTIYDSANLLNFTRTVAGLVPAPGAATTTRYLREDGTWVIPPNTADTHWTTGIRAGASGTNANSVANNPFIKVLDNTTYRSQIQILGGTNITANSDATGKITIDGAHNHDTVYVKKIGDTMSGSLTATSFVKSGVTTPQNYLLQADGGHILKSAFSGSGHTHAYLPLTGGIITGASYNMLTLARSNVNGSSMLFKNSAENLGKLGFASNGVFHLGNGASTDGVGNLLQITSTGDITAYGNINAAGKTITATTFSGNATSATSATSATNLSRSILAGNGLSGGGALNANRTLTLGTPSTLTAASTNDVTATSHTHAITTTNVGAASTIVQTSGNGAIGASRYGFYGVYSSAQTQSIWSMGSQYGMNATTTSLGNLYGLAYSYISVGGSSVASQHQIHFVSNGTAQVSVNLSSASVKATTFIGALSGNASTATALTTNAGSATQPVYFSGGKPVAATAYASASVNYATSAGSITGFTSGWSNSGEHNANNISSNGMWYYTSNGPTVAQGSSTNDGALYSQAHSTTWVAQIAQDYRNGRLFVRGKNNGTWNSWLNILDSGNSSVSGNTITINGTSTTWVNTHRGIQNNLTSTSTVDSLSAAQGRLLANGSARDSTKLPLTGGTLTGNLATPYTAGSWISLATRTNIITPTTANSASSAHALFRLENSTGDRIAFGGLGVNVGFYGYTAARISAETNATDWSTYWNVNTGLLTHNKSAVFGGNVTAPTFIGALTGNAATATKLQTARTINGVSFDGSANITITTPTPATLTRGSYLTGSNFNGSTATTWAVDATSANTASKVVARNASGNFSAGTITASLSGNASSATYASTVTLTADNTTNATRYPLFASAATGNLSPRTDTGFTYNPSTGALTTTSFIGSLTGNASTASTATKVNNKLILKFDTGTTENTNLYTYDGSAAKTIDIKAGSNISFTKTGNTVTINSTDNDTTYSAGTKALLLSGTNTSNRVWSGKTLKDWYLEEIDILLDSDRFTGSTFSSNVIDLTNVNGAFNVNSANNYTTYTLSNKKVRGAWARILVNTSIPITITGVKLINLGSTFEINTDMYLNVIYDGINTLGYYTKVTGSIKPSYCIRTNSTLIIFANTNTPISNFSTTTSSMIINDVNTPKNTIKDIYFSGDYSSTTSIGDNFLYLCTSLTSIDLSSMTNATSIGSSFLQDCSSLTSVDLSSMVNVTSIGSYFLRGCTSLTSIDLSSMTNLTSIGVLLLGLSVKTLKMGAIVPPTLYATLPNTITSILVPSAAVNAYKAATWWSQKASIITGY